MKKIFLRKDVYIVTAVLVCVYLGMFYARFILGFGQFDESIIWRVFLNVLVYLYMPSLWLGSALTGSMSEELAIIINFHLFPLIWSYVLAVVFVFLASKAFSFMRSIRK